MVLEISIKTLFLTTVCLKDNMESSTLSKAALGRIAALGDLYDARKDDFVGISIFNQKIPEDVLTLTDNQFSDIHLIHSDTFSEKFAKLNISAELQVRTIVYILCECF